MVSYRFIEPLDVLFLRGNRLFGDPGSFGESLMPPWPSVAAGAIRSLMLASDGVDPGAFAAGQSPHPSLGTPAEPGAFTLSEFLLARRTSCGVETFHTPPADLLICDEPNTGQSGGEGTLRVQRLRPTRPYKGLSSSAQLPLLPVAAQRTQLKPASNWWLTQAAWYAYLSGEVPAESGLVHGSALWTTEARVGVGLDEARRSASEGKLFSSRAVAMRPGVGFLAGVRGAEPPAEGTLRFGGDGRAASLRTVEHHPPADFERIAAAGRCRLVLTSPGIFQRGWLPEGTGEDHRLTLPGLRARLSCAAVPRTGWVSGFDLPRRMPKPAQRVVPPGSVYWLEDLESSAQALSDLVDGGLWCTSAPNPSRRAEGFNRCTFAAY